MNWPDGTEVLSGVSSSEEDELIQSGEGDADASSMWFCGRRFLCEGGPGSVGMEVVLRRLVEGLESESPFHFFPWLSRSKTGEGDADA
jgi:hypothetical protein